MQAYRTAEWQFSTLSATIVVMPKRDIDRMGPLDVADRLRLTRKALGLTQAAIGRLAGISAQAWNNNEKARDRMSVDQAIKLCTATGVSLDWIYRGDMRGLPHDMAVKIQTLVAREVPPGKRA